ncbi:MAG: hypothetical protein Q4D32_12360 [Eubacteriales bacterium]|nr:hypothetical protein [Eubacteriales bacterium]
MYWMILKTLSDKYSGKVFLMVCSPYICKSGNEERGTESFLTKHGGGCKMTEKRMVQEGVTDESD